MTDKQSDAKGWFVRIRQELALGAFVLAVSFLILALLWLVVAIEAFQWRNPKANSRAGWMHPIAVLTFQRLPEYQERP